MYQETLKQLVSILLDGISRCENCSRSQPFYFCDDCKDNAAQLVSAIVDIVNVLKPDTDLVSDIQDMSYILQPIPETIFTD